MKKNSQSVICMKTNDIKLFLHKSLFINQLDILSFVALEALHTSYLKSNSITLQNLNNNTRTM